MFVDFFSRHWTEIVFSAIYAITVIGCILAVITENRNPVKTMSWLLVLVFIPAIGVILFYFFGQDNRKIKHVSTKYYKHVKDIKDLSFDSLLKSSETQLNNETIVLSRLLAKTNNSAILKGSKIKIFTEGNDKFEALIEDIEAAKHHIHIEYFIFYNDETGNLFKELLMKKAAQGVEVRFLYDNVANWFVPPHYYNEMKESGVLVATYMKVLFPMFHSKLNYRNHRKVVVIDGVIGYMGGMNISNDYRIWRDTHVRIQGKGTHGLQASFLTDWISSGMPMIDKEKANEYFPDCPEFTDNIMQIATGGPINPWRNLLEATIHIATNAQKYLYIQTPYFLPTEGLFHALQAAALGGVDVRLMMPEKADMPIVNPAAHSYFETLLESGVKIYIYQNRFIHAKSIVCDDFTAVVGSVNMDIRSFECNFEINGYIYDPDFALRMKEIFLEDQKNCVRISLEEWRKRPVNKKFWESICRIFSPLF